VNIAVNTRLLIPGRVDGWSRFTHEVLRVMVRKHPEHRFIFLFDRKPHPDFIFGENVKPVTVHPQARHPLLWHIWFEWMLPRVMAAHGADIFLSPDGYLSLRSDIPALPVIHDLNFLHSPQDLPAHHARYLNRNFPLFARKATRIATVSEFSRKDIAENYGISPELIDVVYNGVSERFRPLSDEGKAKARERWTGGVPYMVFIGAMHPRKNIARMLLAYDLFRKKTDSPLKLVMVGNRQHWTTDMEQALRQMEHVNDVIFTGRLTEEELGQVLGGAFANLYVSVFEGFGIPIIEAFQAGVPVVTSNVTSMPEVAGSGAVLVDPLSVESISEGIRSLWSDDSLRESIVRTGLERSRLFTWERTADVLWDSLMKAAHDSPRTIGC
jgi:glycosyltransferase involved in cell wall biosynthesis